MPSSAVPVGPTPVATLPAPSPPPPQSPIVTLLPPPPRTPLPIPLPTPAPTILADPCGLPAPAGPGGPPFPQCSPSPLSHTALPCLPGSLFNTRLNPHSTAQIFPEMGEKRHVCPPHLVNPAWNRPIMFVKSNRLWYVFTLAAAFGRRVTAQELPPSPISRTSCAVQPGQAS